MKKHILVWLLLVLFPVILQAQYIFTDQYGSFDDGSGDESCEDNLDQTYLIQPDGAETIELSFMYLNIEGGCDQVWVYDGPDDSAPLIGTFDNDNYPPSSIFSTGNSLFIRFITDGSVTSDGWTVEYYATLAQQEYYQQYTASGGTFDDGSGTNEYPNSFIGKYLIKPSTPSRIQLSFTSFQTEAGYDFVKIYNGENEYAPLLGTFHGSSLPSSVVSTGNALFIVFTTDGSVTYPGWTVQYSPYVDGKPYNLSLPATSNYIHMITPEVAMQSVPDNTVTRNALTIDEDVQYFDGLGRPLQEVSVFASTTGKDIIQPFAYDDYGRESTRYLPYTRSGSGAYDADAVKTTSTYTTSNQYLFYNGISDFSADKSYPFAKTVFESSPLNRVLETGAPGADWQPTNESGSSSGHTVKTEYTPNTAKDVLLLSVDASGNLVNTGGDVSGNKSYYKEGELFKTIAKDENWTSGTDHTIEEYKDKQGQIILKRTYNSISKLETYYVYDDFGLLRYVLSPKASNQASFPLTKTSTLVKQLCYYYEYDAHNRMILKQLPGAEAVYMVYDKRDRLVLTQDGNSRGYWFFTKYDVLNRPIMTGKCYSPKTHLQLQQDFESYSGNYYEIPVSSGNIGYTLDNSFSSILSINENIIVTLTYYDNYNFININGFNRLYPYQTQGAGFVTTNNTFIKGQVTGTKVKVLNGEEFSSNTYAHYWVNSIIYYDDYYRVIQTRRTLYDGGTGGVETITNQYDFVGKIKQSKQNQLFGANNTTLEKWFTYDHAGRLVKTEQKIDGGNKIITSKLDYNELGKIKSKALHLINESSSAIQTMDYSYNIRGWLEKINNPDNLNGRMFAMQLLYKDVNNNLLNQAQYNGNISGIIWNNTSRNKQGYSFTYDPVNRLTSSDYKTFNGSLWVEKTEYEEKNISYDENGNIKHLERTGINGSSLANYTYYYSDGEKSNRLLKINSSYNNEYDNNGNMIFDGMRYNHIYYNFLNLPFQNGTDSYEVDNIYLATGEKISKYYFNPDCENTTYYAGNMIYNADKTLNYITFEEGRIKKVSGGYKYEYHLKDHLGNVRVAFEPSGSGTSTLQVSDYYPFGLSFNPVNPNNDNKYLYNGKELQDDALEYGTLGWYDYGARFYDPQIGRFHTQDRYAEKYFDFSPYQYAANNPMLFIDINGDSIDLGNLYAKNKEGQYLHPQLIGAFELFASTAEGKQYILDHAQKGFELKGVFIDGLSIKAEEGGKLNDKGVDISLNVGEVVDKNGHSAFAKTDDKVENGRLKLDFTFNNNAAKNSDGDFRDRMLNNVDTYSHEFLLHGDLAERKFLNNSTIEPYSHQESSVMPSSYFGNTNNFYQTPVYRILNSVQSLNLRMNQDKQPYTARQLFNGFVAPGLNWERQ